MGQGWPGHKIARGRARRYRDGEKRGRGGKREEGAAARGGSRVEAQTELSTWLEAVGRAQRPRAYPGC